MQVFYRNWGVADTILGHNQIFIEVNKNLKNYCYAYKETLRHEMEHSKSSGKLDLWLEVKQIFDLRLNWQLLKFHFKYPKAFYQYLPVSKTRNGYGVNLYNIITFGVLAIVVVVLW